MHEALRGRSGPAPISRAGLGREATDEEIAREDQHGDDAVILLPETWNAVRDQVAELLTRPRSTRSRRDVLARPAAGWDGSPTDATAALHLLQVMEGGSNGPGELPFPRVSFGWSQGA
jgi:hypothetical protein